MSLHQLEPVIEKLSRLNGIEAVYVYGSVLSEKFVPGKSDIDFLILADEKSNPLELIESIKKLKESYDGKLRLDLNIVFLSEFRRRVHVNRPPTYYIGILRRSQLVFGKDLLQQVDEKEITPQLMYERVANLAQATRALYISGSDKNASFWSDYHRRWLSIAFLEVLYLQGIFELDKDKGLRQFVEKNHAPAGLLDILDSKKATTEVLFRSAEWLRSFMLKKFKLG